MKIYFIEKSIPFDANDFDKPIIGGSEKTLINIAEELAKNPDLEVKIFNMVNENKKINKVEWININQIDPNDIPDVLISMSDAQLLSKIFSKKNFLWSHSVQSIEKFLRKKQLFAFLKNKPRLILEGKYHFSKRSFLTSFFGKTILPIAVDYDFINENINENFIPDKNAIFTTRSDRNLRFLLECWDKISINSKNAKLYINPPFSINELLSNKGVRLRKKASKADLISDLKNSRVMLNPGHKGEVFCLAAEEARELCIPIVTMGIGSLKERVEHGVTGYIAKNKNEFVEYSCMILNNDEHYLSLKKNLIKKRNSRSYKDVAIDFLKIIYEN